MDKKEISVNIYGLIDPNTNNIRYVGSTTRKLNERLSQHKHDAVTKTGTYKRNWLKSLYIANNTPIIKLIEVCNLVNYEDRETFWIRYYNKIYPLTNTHLKASGIVLNRTIDSREKSAIGHFKKIVQLSIKGEFIKEWDSISEASTLLKILRTNISNCLMKRSKSAGQFIWVYKEEYDNGKFTLPKRRGKKPYLRKALQPVEVIFNNEDMRVFKNIKQFSKFLNVDNSYISKFLRSSMLKPLKCLQKMNIKAIKKL